MPHPAHRVVMLHLAAPSKPAAGSPCNGCGLCCAAAPCPLGIAVSRRLRGPCVALNWRDDEGRYRCGVVDEPGRWLGWIPSAPARRLARRWIAVSAGCDSDLVVD